jgi:ClpP class serine protease
MKMRVFAFVAVLSALQATASSLAAEVVFEGVKEINPAEREARFHLKGEITAADVQNVKDAITNAHISYEDDPSRKIVISLDSPGGTYHAAQVSPRLRDAEGAGECRVLAEEFSVSLDERT